MEAMWLETNQYISVGELTNQGIGYQEIPVAVHQKILDHIKEKYQYTSQDIVELSPDMPNLEKICAQYDKEHLHTDDEVRFVEEGEGYFDIRSSDDRWMRVFVRQGDFILIPANRYHRFYLKDTKRIKAIRLFKDNPNWVPIYRQEGGK